MAESANIDTDLRYIAIEGMIGVGKTALAIKLAEKLNARCVLEEVEENPFLANFYQDMRTYALPTQLFFLLSRHRQQQQISQQALFQERIVSDYTFYKDRIFAYLNLSDHELKLYEKIYDFLEKDVPKPDLVVYLQASIPLLLERIKKRGRSFEQDISPEYLEALSDAYNRFFLHYDATPLLIVNTANLDFVKNEDDFVTLFKEIITTTQGRRFFSPRTKKIR
ncbi:MAG: deoxynucleoside kinase [candidate division WOR-3 bacterium]|nr:deoxynucleoside kinase [candidate division WOR-3 bacterium]